MDCVECEENVTGPSQAYFIHYTKAHMGCCQGAVFWRNAMVASHAVLLSSGGATS